VGIAFDEILHAGEISPRMRSISPTSFDADYSWIMTHQDDAAEQKGPSGEYLTLYRYAFFASWTRFESRGRVTIADPKVRTLITLDLTRHTFHRYTSGAAKRYLERGPSGPYFPPHFDKNVSVGGLAIFEQAMTIRRLGSLRLQRLPTVGLEAHSLVRSVKATGTCVTGDHFGSVWPFRLTGMTRSYRADEPEPGEAYVVPESLPFTEVWDSVCDRHYHDLTPKASKRWDAFLRRLLVFEWSEEDRQTSQFHDEGVDVRERGHFVHFSQPADRFSIPAGFVDDCTVPPRPDDCAKQVFPELRLTRTVDTGIDGSAIRASPDGTLWFVGEIKGSPPRKMLAALDTNGKVTAFDLSEEVGFNDLAVARDATVWVAEGSRHTIAHYSLLGLLREFVAGKDFDLGNHPVGLCEPANVAIAKDGSVWFTCSSELLTIAPNSEISTRKVSEDPISFSALNGGPAGDLWYIQGNTPTRVVRIDGKQITEYRPAFRLSTLERPVTDGTYLWFSEDSRLARIDRDGRMAHYPLSLADASPDCLALAPNGDIWFDESPRKRIGVLRAGADRVVEYELPTAVGGIAVRPDGSVWVTTNGGVAEIEAPTR
jgi:streptogramin lyase